MQYLIVATYRYTKILIVTTNILITLLFNKIYYLYNSTASF